LSFLSESNGSVADKNTLLLDFDPEAPPPTNPTNTYTPSPNDSSKQFANISSQQANKSETLFDFEGSTNNAVQQEQEFNLTTSHNSTFDTTSPNIDENVPLVPQSNEQEQQLLNQAYDDVDNAAQELSSKIDFVTSPSPPPTSDRQPPPSFHTEQQPGTSTQSVTSPKVDSTLPTASPAKKPATSIARPTNAAKTKPTSATAATSKSTEHKTTAAAAAPKSTEHKPATTAAAAATASKSTEHKSATSTTKSTEPKPSTTGRKTLHSAPPTSAAATSNKSKVTPTSPSQESSTVSKPTVNISFNLTILLLELIFFS